MLFRSKKKICYVGKNLDYLLAQHHLDLKNLAASTGVSVPTIVRMKRDDSNPTISSLEPILDFFRVDAQSFLYEDMSSSEYQKKKQLGTFVPIPIYSLQEIASGISNPKITQFIGSAGITSEKTFGISVNTDTLVPAFQKNSIILIDPTLEQKEGDYVFCSLGNDSTAVFRQIFMDGKEIFFKPVNPGFGGMKSYDNYNILGVVIKSIESYR